MFLVRSLIGAESANFPFKIGEEIPNRRATIWKQYTGTKSGTSEAVSIFTLNKQSSPDKVNIAKHLIQKLKILRYPHVLKFIDSVELTNVIHVVTEPVVPLDLNDLDAARGSSSTTDTTEDEKRDEGKAKILQVALGLHQIVSALSWLSNECKLVHGFLFPGSIYVTRSGDWKLSGFDIAYKHGDPLPDVTREFRQHLLPQQYRSPEFQKQDWSVLEKGPVWALDSWSLGCFIYEVFNGTFESPHVLTQPAQIPPQLLTDYKRLLSTNVNSRLNPSKVLENSFFDNELVKTVNFLDSLALKSNDEKNAFFTHFSKFVQNFPTATCKYKILPQLTHALDYGSGMSCFSAILTSVLKIGAMLTPEEFVEQVIPSVVKLFSSNERAVRVHLLQHMSEFGPHLTADLVNNQLFSHVITGFTDSSALLRELTVKSLTHFVSKLNSNNMDQVLRFLAKLQTDMEPAIRTNTTYCLAKIAPHVGASSREKILIPGLSKTLRDPFPPARVASLVAFLVTLEYHPAPVCARRIFPLVIPFACDPVKEVREACLRLCSAMMNKLTTASQEMGDVSDDGQQSQQPTQATTQGYGATPTDVSNAAANVLGYVGSWAINSIKNKMLGADDTPAGMVKSAMTVAAVSAYTASLTSPSTTTPSSRPAPSPSPSASSFSSSSTKPPATTTTSSASDGWGDTNDDFFNDTAGDDTMVAALSIGKKKEKTEKPDKKSGRREPAKPMAVVSSAGLDDDSGFGSAGWGDDDIPDVGGAGDDDDWSASLSSSKPSSHNKTTSITSNNDDDFFDSLTTTKPKPKSTTTSTTVKPSTSTSSLSLANKKKPVITSITSTSSSSTSKAADKDDWSFLND